jgi:hypothetical protein
MSELITTLGAGLLAAPYSVGSGSILVTPSAWPDGLPFPAAGVFSVSLKTGPGPKFPVYTVASFTVVSGNLLMVVALEAGDDTAALAGAIVSEVLTARSLAALISAPVYRSYYLPGGFVTTSEFAGAFNVVNLNQLALVQPELDGEPATGPGVLQFDPGGGSAFFPFRIPSSWDGSPILLKVDASFVAFGSGDGSFSTYSAAVVEGGDLQNVAWSAQGAVVTVAGPGGGTQTLAVWDLVVPSSNLAPGGFAYIALVRSATDSFSSAILVIGSSLSIKS